MQPIPNTNGPIVELAIIVFGVYWLAYRKIYKIIWLRNIYLSMSYVL